MRPPTIRLHQDELVVDNFAGGGGASLGIEWATGRSPDIAVNHDPEAIAMHEVNHPRTRHLCGDVWDVDPKAVCGGRSVGLAWFSPDCTHFSKAKGGKPRCAKRRALAWVVVRWARAVRPRVLLCENVEEFADWGPLLADGRPDPAKLGFTFRRWVGTLRAAGYQVEMRELRASDYGAPTIRKRLFIVARCDGHPIVWPTKTHGPGTSQAHRAAAECIDWSLPCPSIFERSRPLADKTLRRIARGIQRFVIDSAEPFVIPVTHAGDERSHAVSEPLRTVTGAHRGEHALVSPYFTRTDMHLSNAGCAYPPGDPLRTLTTAGGHALVSPTLVQTGYGEREGQAPRSLDLFAPLGTVVGCGQKHALVSAFLAKHYGDPGRATGGGQVIGSELARPIGTVTVRDHHGLVAAHMLKLHGSCADGQTLARPAPTVRAGGWHLAEVRAFLTRYNRTGGPYPMQLPLGSVTSRDRFGLVRVAGDDYAIADIGMRMLQPRELFRAQGFHDGYVIDRKPDGGSLTKTAQIRLCGNSVCSPIAAAIVRANLGAEQAEVA